MTNQPSGEIQIPEWFDRWAKERSIAYANAVENTDVDWEDTKLGYEAGATAAFRRLSGLSGKDGLIKFLDWFLLNYMNSQGATANQTRNVVERFIREQ